MEIEQIIELINTVSNSNLTAFSYENGDTKISMEAEKKCQAIATTVIAPENISGISEYKNIVVENNNSETEKNSEKKLEGNIVKSPLVGTFYSAPSPDEKDFVQVGDKVKKGQVLGIVEAMKLMNEIESEFDGEVVEILINNNGTVEFGQPLFVIK